MASSSTLLGHQDTPLNFWPYTPKPLRHSFFWGGAANIQAAEETQRALRNLPGKTPILLISTWAFPRYNWISSGWWENTFSSQNRPEASKCKGLLGKKSASRLVTTSVAKWFQDWPCLKAIAPCGTNRFIKTTVTKDLAHSTYGSLESHAWNMRKPQICGNLKGNSKWLNCGKKPTLVYGT